MSTVVKIVSLVHTNLQACTFQTLPSQIPCDIMLAATGTNAGIIDAGGLDDGKGSKGIMLGRAAFSPSSCIPLPKFKIFAIIFFVC